MAIYDFKFNPPNSANVHSPSFADSNTVTQNPQRLPDYSEKSTDLIEVHGTKNLAPETIIEVANKGFYVLDEGMKNWLSGIQVPTRSGSKMASVHVVSHDKSILAWAQEFFDGRVPLPAISIQRQSWAFDSSHFTPPYKPFQTMFADISRKRMRMIYRPIPFKVEFNITIWGQFKQDIEYIDANIITRCNPLGEFEVEDERLQQYVRVKHNGSTSQSEVDIDAKTKPKVQCEISMTADFALNVNEKLVPTILGKVVSIKEMDTNEVFEVYRAGEIP